MSDTEFYLSLAIAVLIFGAMIVYVIKGKIDQKRSPPNAYRWKPEQDYDVVMQGETPMTPGFPVLKKRKKPGAANQSTKDKDSNRQA